ncbi:hypothetical protein LguiA_006119 [Lonicera macranthoides]
MITCYIILVKISYSSANFLLINVCLEDTTYNEEDVQVLRLQKERWELVDSSCKPIKVQVKRRLLRIQTFSFNIRYTSITFPF